MTGVRAVPTVKCAAAPSRTRRGHMYVAILMTAMLITVIGLSGLTLARVQMRTQQDEADLVRADAYARAALDLGLQRAASDGDWRTTFVRSTWRIPTTFQSGSITWRLVDENDGDPTTEPRGPFRLSGLGACGPAQRIYSVLVEAPPSAGELVNNPRFESGATGWLGQNCQLVAGTIGGNAALIVQARANGDAGPTQNFLGQVRSDGTYAASVRVDPVAPDRRYTVALDVVTSKGSYQAAGTVDVAGGEDDFSATLRPKWTGTLESITLRVYAPDDMDDIELLRVEISEVRAGPLRIVPNTLRREPGNELISVDPVEVTPSAPTNPLIKTIDGLLDLLL